MTCFPTSKPHQFSGHSEELYLGNLVLCCRKYCIKTVSGFLRNWDAIWYDGIWLVLQTRISSHFSTTLNNSSKRPSVYPGTSRLWHNQALLERIPRITGSQRYTSGKYNTLCNYKRRERGESGGQVAWSAI